MLNAVCAEKPKDDAERRIMRMELVLDTMTDLTRRKTLSKERAIRSLKPANGPKVSTINCISVPSRPVSVKLLNLVHAGDITICRRQLLRLSVSLRLHIEEVCGSAPTMSDPLLPVPNWTRASAVDAPDSHWAADDDAWWLEEASTAWVAMAVHVIAETANTSALKDVAASCSWTIVDDYVASTTVTRLHDAAVSWVAKCSSRNHYWATSPWSQELKSTKARLCVCVRLAANVDVDIAATASTSPSVRHAEVSRVRVVVVMARNAVDSRMRDTVCTVRDKAMSERAVDSAGNLRLEMDLDFLRHFLKKKGEVEVKLSDR